MSVVKPIPNTVADDSVAGYWQVHARPYSATPLDVTVFRGVPVELETMTFSDPFGPRSATLRAPQVTYFERLGDGDLSWLAPLRPLQIEWNGLLPANYPYGRIQTAGDPVDWWHGRLLGTAPAFSWQDRMSSFNWSEAGLGIECQGAYYDLDDYLAKPEYPDQPMPYEWAIARQLLNRPSLRLKPLTVVWPSWYSKKYSPPPKGTPHYRIPVEVRKGRYWTGLLTRHTGSWDPVGTSYIQALLSSMYTRRGRWTIDIMADGKPVLLHREIEHVPADHIVVVDVAGTNVLSFDQDWTQSLSVIYAQGQSLAGVQFSGMQISPSGDLTRYEPMAALRQVHPEDHKHNEWLQPGRARREVMLSMQQGLDELQAEAVAQAHLERFSEPGVTGRVTLKEDPTVGGEHFSRMLVRAGMSIQIPNVLGSSKGIIAHVTENTVNFKEETNELTFDTKYRDSLTVNEVRMRGRDSLAVPRMLAVGQYEPPVPDQLIPWNYNHGSGFLPRQSTELFDEMPDGADFPWERWTRAHPPRKAKWRKSYVRIGPASDNANGNWAYVGQGIHKTGKYGVPVRFAQSGDIRLFQIAAYDSDGNVLPVPFHISIYTSRGVNIASMPLIPALPGGGSAYPPFAASQHYPFGKDAWNRYTASGTLTHPQIPHPTTTVGLVRGYGDYYERAGYWPGSSGAHNPATGLLVDESVWHFDTTAGGPNVFKPYSIKQPKWAGHLYAMIYCDAQGSEPVYFLGRFFRAEPGAQS